MQFATRAPALFVGVFSSIVFARAAVADADDAPARPVVTITNSTGGADTRYGLFDSLDHRSAYTQEVFPEPFLVEDMALEDNELEFNWLHSKSGKRQSDTASIEYQKGFGLLTLEAAIPFQRIVTTHGTLEGLGDLELGTRYPFYQFVSANRMVDATCGAALEAGIPLQLRVDRNAELEPEAFCCLRLGEHFTMQTLFGYDVLFGDGDNGGERSYDYGASLAYAIPRRQLPLPGVEEFIPMFELADEQGLNKDERGLHDLEGDAGFRLKLHSFGELQPNLGLAYVFPLDSVAHQELHWGFIASLIFEF